MYRSVAADISQQLEQDGQPDLPPPISDKQRQEAQDAASWVQSGSIARERDQVSSDLAHIRSAMGVAQGIGSHFGRLNQMGIERQQQIDIGERQLASGLDTTPGATGTRYGSFEGHARPLPELGSSTNPLPDVANSLNTLLQPISDVGGAVMEKALPIYGNLSGVPAVDEEQAQQRKEIGHTAGEFIAPVVADVASGGTLSILYGAQAAANISNSVSEYAQGNISEMDLLKQIGLTAPQLIPVLLHGGSKLAKLAQSPEGQQALRQAVDTLKAKGSQAGSKLAEERGSLGTGPEEPAGLAIRKGERGKQAPGVHGVWEVYHPDTPNVILGSADTAKGAKALAQHLEQSGVDWTKHPDAFTPEEIAVLPAAQRVGLEADYGAPPTTTESPSSSRLSSAQAALDEFNAKHPTLNNGRDYTRLQALRQEVEAARGSSAETGAAVPVEGQAGAPPPSQPLRLSDEQQLAQLEARKHLTRGQELTMARLRRQIAADPAKWQVGQGVGYKPTNTSQINRGYRIEAVDPASKTAVVRMVQDTGHLADASVGATERVHIADLVRDKRFDGKSEPRAARAAQPQPPAVELAADPAARISEIEAEQNRLEATNNYADMTDAESARWSELQQEKGVLEKQQRVAGYPAQRAKMQPVMDAIQQRLDAGEDVVVPSYTKPILLRGAYTTLKMGNDGTIWYSTHGRKPFALTTEAAHQMAKIDRYATPLEPPPPSQEAPQPAAGSSGDLPPTAAPKATQGEVWQFKPSPEELTHLHNLIDHGDWTETPGARIGARSIVKKLLNGEAPSDKQFAMLQRVLTSKQPTVEVAPKAPATPRLKRPKIPIERRATMAARGAQPDLSPVEPMGGEPFPFPKSDAGALQPALADNLTDAYVGAISAGKNGSAAETTGRFTRVLQQVTSPLALVKTIKTSFDIGWAGRQGWRLLPRNPFEWFRMYGRQYKAFASEAAYEEMQAASKAYPWRARADASQRPLALLERGTGSPETSGEEFLSVAGQNRAVDLARKVLDPSERAYVAPGNLMRAEVFDKQLARATRAKGSPLNDAEFQLLEDNLNNATLRGNTKWLGKTNAQTLASLLFSLKGQVSGPQFAMDAIRAVINGGGKYSPEVRKIVAEQFGAYVAMGMSTLGLAAAAGFGLDKAGKPSWVNVDLNDLSPTFGQISIGGMRWNYWGADQSLVRTAIQVARRKTQNKGLPAQDASIRRLLSNFAGNKVAPGVPKFAWDELVNAGKTKNSGIFHDNGMDINTPLGFLNYAFDQVAPITGESAVGAYKDLGPAAVPFSLAAESHGLSTSTYDASPSADEIKSADRKSLESKLPDEDKIFQKTRDTFTKGVGFDASGYDSLADYEDAFVAKYAPLAVKSSGGRLSLPEAETATRKHFLTLQPVKTFKSGVSAASLQFWKDNPKLLSDLVARGSIKPTDAEQKIVDTYRKAVQEAAGVR